MLPLSQTTGYAVRALRCLQEPGGQPVLVEEVAEYTGIPRSYLSKLIHKLAKRGLVAPPGGTDASWGCWAVRITPLASFTSSGTPRWTRSWRACAR